MSDKTNRYANIPISEETKRGMSLTIDDLAAICRVLSLQDDVYDEQFEKTNKLLCAAVNGISALRSEVSNLEDMIHELALRINKLEEKIDEINVVVDVNKRDIETLKTEVADLKRKHTIWNFIWKYIIGLSLTIMLVRILHGPFKIPF